MRTCFLMTPAAGAGQALAARVAHLSRQRSVLVVAGRIGLAGLQREYQEAGVDMSHVFILDAITGDLEGHPADTRHAMRVPGPSSLELIASRAEKVVRRLAEHEATVLVDDLNTFVRYNGAAACAQMIAYSKTHLLGSTSRLEVAVQPDLDEAAWETLEGLLDGLCPLAPDGTLDAPGEGRTTRSRSRSRGPF